MVSKPKAPSVNMAPAIKSMEKYTPDVVGANLGPLGSARATAKGKDIFGQIDVNPAIAAALQSSFGRMGDFGNLATQRASQARQASFQPIQSGIEKQLGDYFSSLGPSGRRSSRGQTAMATFADRLGEQEGRRLYDIGEQARGRQLTEDQGRLGMAFQPFQFLAGQASPSNLASLRAGMGRQMGSSLGQAAQTNAQMQARANAQRGGMFGSLLGAGIGMGTKALTGGLF